MIKRVFNKLKRVIFEPLKQRQIARAVRRGYKLATRRELQALLAAPALINDPEIAVFEKYAPIAQKTIVEIGAAYGGSSLLFLMNKKNGVKVFSIDPFVKDSMGDFQATEKKCFSHVSRALRRIGLGERVRNWILIPEFSFNVVKNWSEPIDVLFIDGDHHYEAVKKDFDDWFRYVKVGGFILFHDSCRPGNMGTGYDRGWPGPSKLVRELKEDHRGEIVEQVHSVTVMKKLNE